MVKGKCRMKLEKKRLVVFIIGLIFIALGIAIFLKAGWGSDPFTVMNKGISGSLGVSFGLLQVIVNGILIIIIFKVDKSKLRLGTVLNMLLIGPAVDIFESIAGRIGINATTVLEQGLLMGIGCVILSLGVGMAFASNVGMGPYDLISIIIAERKKYSFKWMRIGTDIICVTIGGILGAVVGIGTVVSALFMGPLIELFKEMSLKYILK